MDTTVNRDSTPGKLAALRYTRRQALGAAGAWGLIRPSLAQPVSASNAPGATEQLNWRALSRVGYGPTPSLLESLRSAKSPQDWALQQVSVAYVASQRLPVMAADLAGLNAPLPDIFAAERRERELRRQIKTQGSAEAPPKPQVSDLRHFDFSAPPTPELAIQRLVQQTAAWHLSSCSLPELENPLLARMTEFWFNHLNVYAGKGPVRPFVGHYLVNVIRAHAMGRFEDLLLASARHPAMLLYLDQAQSVADGSPGAQGQKRGLNENYARELMELHTLGVNGGYTQHDVRDLARVLTGWTIGPRQASGFRFAARLHDNGNKQVLGQMFPSTRFAAGEQEGVDAIQMLARHPATARRISLRLAQFFVADKPDQNLVDQLAQTFESTHGDISALLTVLFRSPDFWNAENRLLKTPMDFACSALTVTHASADPDRHALALAAGYLAGAGQALHGWQTPDGYPFDAATWIAPEALTRRADFALALARQRPEPDFLKPFLSATTLTNIDREPAALRAGLMLASPDFMSK